MLIIGVDYHPSFQQIAILNQERLSTVGRIGFLGGIIVGSTY
jgi:hypothetical protein